MADFTIASQVGGGGGGQNALAGGGGFNPNTMFQLMQMKQTMELQRLAEQRALAGEARAAALHGPALEAANLRVKEARLGLGAAERTEQAAREEKEFNDRYFGLLNQGQDPSDPLVMEPFKKGDAKFYSYLRARKATEDANALAGEQKTVQLLTDSFNHLKQTADMTLRNIDRITDQKSYSAIRDRIIKAAPHIAGALKPEFTPENLADLKNTLEGVVEIKPIDLGENIKGLMRGNTILGLVDPTKPNFLDNSLVAIETVRKGLSATGAPTGAQPRAAAPQTMGFSGMNQLAPAGQQAAQSVLQNFPGARITSGLRTPERNAAVGGATASYHLSGNAIDVVPPAGMPMNVFAAQLQQQLGPQGYTVMYGDPGHLDHVHIQPGQGMNVPRQFSPSVAATDVAAGRTPTGMMAPAAPVNAMAPLAAMSLMQNQNAMVQPQAPANIAPGLTAAATPAAGVAAPATTTPEAGAPPRREDYATYGQFVEAQKNYRARQEKLADQAAADRRALEAEARKAAQEIDIFKQKEGIKAAAETQKKEEAELKFVNDLLPELRSITAPGGLISQSTGSGAGAAFDTTAAFFGAATEGAKAAARLKPIADAALKAVPRFEGPQSDKDTQSYKEAAGELANEKLPRETRIAAGQEMLRLLQKRQVQIEMKRGDTTTARRPSDMTVIAPNGTPYNFPTKEQADAYFKQVYK